jgi:septal ring factor EnvC (AmiA/AmiB activator)
MDCLTHHLLKKLNKKLNTIMANINDLTAKVDALQASLDAEQQQIADAIAALNQSIIDLQAMVADGGTVEERQALADKLDAIKADLEGTIADAPTEPGA